MDSEESTPQSDHHHDEASATVPPPRLRFMCSFNGKILPRPHDNQLRYVGGDTRMISVNRNITYSAIHSKLSKIVGTTNISIKYQLPNEDLDSLITVTSDEDIENMMEEYDRQKSNTRLRIFLFQADFNVSRTNSIGSLLDGSVKRENWFFDALNGRPGSGQVLERGRSEVSSIVSEVPDYLFGFDTEDPLKDSFKLRNKSVLSDSVFISRPNSPATVIQDLPPVKTDLVSPTHQVVENKETEMMVNEKILVSQPIRYSGVGPGLQYPNPQVPTVYYMPESHIQGGNVQVQAVPVRPQFIQPYPVGQGQIPIGFPGMGQVYGAGVRPYEMLGQVFANNATQAMYYGPGNVAVVPGSYPGMVVAGGEETQVSGKDVIPMRVSQGS